MKSGWIWWDQAYFGHPWIFALPFAILIEHAGKQSAGTTSVLCCGSCLLMAEFITLWLSARDKSA